MKKLNFDKRSKISIEGIKTLLSIIDKFVLK
jgi:hypothetical protein